jgi:ParB family chromosome partitioning protein
VLAEVDESLCSAKLNRQEMGLFLRRRKEIYEAMHPETRNGGTGKNHTRQLSENGKAEKTPSFVDDTAARTGFSKTKIYDLIAEAEAEAPMSTPAPTPPAAHNGRPFCRVLEPRCNSRHGFHSF